MAERKKSLKREKTTDITAKEAAEFLKNEGYHEKGTGQMETRGKKTARETVETISSKKERKTVSPCRISG
jgi:hypothetical protein